HYDGCKDLTPQSLKIYDRPGPGDLAFIETFYSKNQDKEITKVVSCAHLTTFLVQGDDDTPLRKVEWDAVWSFEDLGFRSGPMLTYENVSLSQCNEIPED